LSKLYKCTLECKIKGFPFMVEYLRASSDNLLIKMFDQCENIVGSTYYGYKWMEIIPVKLTDFPKIMTVEVELK